MNHDEHSPNTDSDRRLLRHWLSRWMFGSGLLLIGTGCAALLGWQMQADSTLRLALAPLNIKANTALGFVLLGVALCGLLLPAPKSDAVARGMGLLLALLGLATLAEYLFGRDIGIDALLVNAISIGSTELRMSILSALNFFLLGTGLFLNARKHSMPGQTLELLCTVVCLLALCVSFYEARPLYTYGQYALLTPTLALLFLIAATGLLLGAPQSILQRTFGSDEAGSILARRMLPILLFMPLILGWLSLYGAAEGWYDTVFGTSLLVVAVITGLSGVTLWIGELLNAKEDAIQEQSGLLESILDNMSDGVGVVDANANPRLLNRAAAQLFGPVRSPPSAETRNQDFGIFDPETHAPLPPQDAPSMRALHGEHVNGRELYIRNEQVPDGTYISCSSRPLRDKDSRIIGAVSVFHDITAQKQAHDIVRKAARYEETLGAALTLYNRGAERDDMLRSLLRLLAEHHPFPVSAFYRHDEWQGIFVLETAYAAASDLATEIHPGVGIIGQAAADNELRVLATGLTIDVGLARKEAQAVVVVPVNHQENRQGLLVLACEQSPTDADLALLMRLCSQLGIALYNLLQRDNMKLLTRSLRERSEEIAEKNRQLEEASRLKSEFLANMSHELRTPLNAIIGFSEAMRDGLVGSLNPEQQTCVRDIYDSGQHLLALINDVLDLSKIEAGHMTLSPEQVDVKTLLENSISIVREKAFAHRLNIQLDVPETLPALLADGRKLKQIVYNLLSNAVKFTPEGGYIQVGAQVLSAGELTQKAVDLRSSDPVPGHEYLGITIRDDGIGISHDDLQKLFQPFMQIDSSMTRRYGGTGLGLAMVNRLTALHGGIVSVQSQPGAGSTFGIWLPQQPAIRQPPTPGSNADVSPADTSSAPPLALIIEDDARSAETIRLFLQEENFRTLIARDGASAVQLAMEHHFDLITLDLILPGMDGWETLARLKSLPAGQWPNNADTPVVIVSIVGDDNAQKGIALGARAVLQKPLERQALINALKTVGLHMQIPRSACILIVDDDPAAVDILNTYMRDLHGFDVHSAYSGREAITLARSLKPDLLVLDLMMPEVSGFDVVQELQREAESRDIPIIILTARELTPAERTQLHEHVKLIMRKADFTRSTFLHEVRRALHAGNTINQQRQEA